MKHLTVTFIAVLLCAASAHAQNCTPIGSTGLTLEWNVSQEFEIVEYRLYKTQVSGDYDLSDPHFIVGHPNNTYDDQIGGDVVPPGRWFFVLTSSDGVVQSLPSNEVCADISTFLSPVLTLRPNP